MERGRKMREGEKEEIEEERINGDEEKSTSLPRGMNGEGCWQRRRNQRMGEC